MLRSTLLLGLEFLLKSSYLLAYMLDRLLATSSSFSPTPPTPHTCRCDNGVGNQSHNLFLALEITSACNVAWVTQGLCMLMSCVEWGKMKHNDVSIAMSVITIFQKSNFSKPRFQKFQMSYKLNQPLRQGSFNIFTIICRYCNKLGHMERECR